MPGSTSPHARPRSPRARLRLPLAAAFLAALAALAASCVEAAGLDGYVDAVGDVCALVDRCYGPAFETCEERVGPIAELAKPAGPDGAEEENPWLALVSRTGCLEGCNGLVRCLDFAPICGELGGKDGCKLSEDCCGFTAGAAVCYEEVCCRPLGGACESDGECCADIGFCDAESHTCGGVVCAAAGEACVNDFVCCTGRCSEDGLCEDLPCPPEGFACESDADCCELLCDPTTKRCTDPSCSLLGEPCIDAGDCCDPTQTCNTGGTVSGVGGLCSNCDKSPDNTDCFSDDQCCSGHCVLPYHLCGQCAAKGEPCSTGIPCCGDMECNLADGFESGTCAVKAMGGTP